MAGTKDGTGGSSLNMSKQDPTSTFSFGRSHKSIFTQLIDQLIDQLLVSPKMGLQSSAKVALITGGGTDVPRASKNFPG